MKNYYEDKIPVIFPHPTSWNSFHIFNPNDWAGESKAIVLSCAAQSSLIHYTSDRIEEVLKNADTLCQPGFLELDRQWRTSKWPLKKTYYLVEIPEAHLAIQGFHISIKTFLDTITQLISTEGIVAKKIHGFHKKGPTIGGELLEILKRPNPPKAPVASSIEKLLLEHKSTWIDQAVNVRDDLAHVKRGMTQVMFELSVKPEGEGLTLLKIRKPKVNNKNVNEYAKKVIEHIDNFSRQFLSILRNSRHL